MTRRELVERNEQLQRKPPVIEVEFERHWRVPQVAKAWGVSATMVRNLFRDEPGVVFISGRLASGAKRPYRTMLIPDSVVKRVYAKMRAAS